MIKKIRQQYDIELSPDDLRVLARTSGILEEITSSAIDGVVGFEIKGVPSTLNYERYSIKEFSHCMIFVALSANSRAILTKIPNNGCAARAPICRILPTDSAIF